MHGSCINFHFLSIHVYFSRRDNLIQNLSLQCKRKEKSHCHGSKISGSQQTVVLPIWWGKNNKNFFCALLHLGMKGLLVFSFHHWTIQMAVRLCPGRLLIQKSCFHDNVTSLISLWKQYFVIYLTVMIDQ